MTANPEAGEQERLQALRRLILAWDGPPQRQLISVAEAAVLCSQIDARDARVATLTDAIGTARSQLRSLPATVTSILEPAREVIACAEHATEHMRHGDMRNGGNVMSTLAELNAHINSRYARHGMDVLYRGIQNFEGDERMVEAGRAELEEFADRLARLLQRNSTRAAA